MNSSYLACALFVLALGAVAWGEEPDSWVFDCAPEGQHVQCRATPACPDGRPATAIGPVYRGEHFDRFDYKCNGRRIKQGPTGWEYLHQKPGEQPWQGDPFDDEPQYSARNERGLAGGNLVIADPYLPAVR